jgi:hypothetical protein
MADHAATPVSPKVNAGLFTGLALTVLAAGAAAITPDTLKDLGVWALPAYAAITAGAGYLAGRLKSDSLREAGQEALDKGLVSPKG